MKDLSLSIFDSYEFYTCSTRIYDIVKNLTNDPYVVSLCTKIKTGTTGMEKAMGKALKSNFTSILLNLDKERDQPFLGLRDHVHSLTHSKDNAKATAAVNLSTIIADIGNTIYSLSYTDETAKMNTLITALKGADAAQWLITTGGDGWFSEIIAAQLAFENAYNSKNVAETEINIPLLKESKAIIAKALKGVLSYVDNNTEFNAGIFKPLEEQIDAVITDMLTIARNRITREENEKKEKEKTKTS
jgi:hypothetical protein